jgi:Ras-related protein Rab-1A
MIVYDITDRESFKSVDNWMSEVDKFASQNVNKLLIGNKIDLTSDREVTYEEGQVNKSFITMTNF